MKGQFFAVYIKCEDDDSYNSIKDKMNKALDWYRVSSNFWIVYTSSDVGRLYGRYKALIGSKGRLFVVKLDLNDRQGWMSKGFWAWIKKERE